MLPKHSLKNLDVFNAACEFLGIAEQICEELPKGRAELKDQLSRAALSIVLNISEGAGKWSRPDKRKYYRNARGSATECLGALHACRLLKLADVDLLEKGELLIDRVIAMLTAMCR